MFYEKLMSKLLMITNSEPEKNYSKLKMFPSLLMMMPKKLNKPKMLKTKPRLNYIQKFCFSILKPKNFSRWAPVSSFPPRNLFPERTTDVHMQLAAILSDQPTVLPIGHGRVWG